MKAVLKREIMVQKGMFGGSKGAEFTVHARCILSPDEERLVRNNGLDRVVLTQYLGFIDSAIDMTAGELIKGVGMHRKNFIEALAAESDAERALNLMSALLRWASY